METAGVASRSWDPGRSCISASFSFASCESKQEQAAESKAETVEANADAKADAMEAKADATREAGDNAADAVKAQADTTKKM